MNSVTTVKVVFRASAKNKKYGSLHIRTTRNRKSKFKSLKIHLSRRHWDGEAQRVMPSLKREYKLYNSIIEDALVKVRNSNNSIEGLTKSNVSILEFWHIHNSTTRNAGTFSIRTSSYKKFRAYLASEGKLELRLQDLDPATVQRYNLYLDRDLVSRSVKTYMGYFKSVINQAIKQQVIPSYAVDPFINTNIAIHKNKKAKALTVEQMKVVMEGALPPNRGYYRNMFCFQTLAGGLRVRDLIMLKWKNIFINDKGIYLQYTQAKTKKQITSKLSYKALGFLISIFEETHKENVDSVKEILLHLKLQMKQKNEWEVNNKYSEFDSQEVVLEYTHYDVEDKKRYKLDKIPRKDAERLTLDGNIKKYTLALMQEYVGILQDLNQSNPEGFIFKLLKNLDIPFNGHLTPILNRQIQGQIHKYNYHLKILSKELSLPKITSHIARHTFTQLLVNSNTNLHFIQQMLGHSSLGVTQNYVASLHTTQLDEISETIAKQF